MKYSQLADGRGRAVMSVESDPMLRLDEGTKMELFQHRPADTVTITPFGGWGWEESGMGVEDGEPTLSKCLFFPQHLHLSLS